MAKIAIEVGHGGSDPGAVANGFLEKDITLEMALELKKQLSRHGQTVLLSRRSDVDDKAADFFQTAKNWQPDLGVSVHVNAGKGFGFEVYYQVKNKSAAELQVSQRLCRAVEAEVTALGQKSRGLKPSEFLMSSLPCPYAYCELGFIDNKADLEQFDTPAKQRNFSAAYARGILNFIGVPWIEEPVFDPKLDSVFDGIATAQKTLYRVVSGSYYDRANAEAWQKKLKEAGFESFLLAEASYK